MSDGIPSSWNTYPTRENPSSRYKFMSIEVNMNLDKKRFSRQTYSLLDWLGDIGGLSDALLPIVGLLVSPLSSFAL